MIVPFNNLLIQYNQIKDEVDSAIQKVISDQAFISGYYAKKFENEFAKKLNVPFCISCGNGTDAIFISLMALGIGPGAEVITTALSWSATAEAISKTGAQVVFVDIDDYYHIDSSQIESKINSRTKAILPVHLYGQSVKVDKIKSICQKHGLYLIEDCAQSHLSRYKNKNTGTFGDVGTFSFYPGKNLGAFGDAGAVITSNEKLALGIRRIANHGCLVKHEHSCLGTNSRMDGIQAAVLSVKLPYIDEWNDKRNIIAQQYQQNLSSVQDVTLSEVRPDATHVFHLYVIRAARRDELKLFLESQGIQTGVHYPKGLPFLTSYKFLNHQDKEFPNLKKIEKQIISLPIFPDMTIDQCHYVTEKIIEFYNIK